MTIPVAPEALQQALHAAAARATLAPSIHNSQPWKFVIHGGGLDVIADRTRSAPVIDPAGRHLVVSCGAALFGARAALAAAGLEAVTVVLPDSAQTDLLASIAISGRSPEPDGAAQRLDAAAERRHSNRRQFTAERVPAEVVDVLTAAAEVEGAFLQEVRGADDRIVVATLTQRADAIQNADPAYRAEMRAWTGHDPGRTDGIPAAAVPHTTGQAHDDIPIRDFDTTGAGGLPAETRSRMDQTMFVLSTASDGPRDWVIGGQALGRVLLEVTSAGYVASILSQVVEVPTLRQQLRHELRLSGQPHLMLRVGAAEPTPASPRRPLAEVISTEAVA